MVVQLSGAQVAATAAALLAILSLSVATAQRTFLYPSRSDVGDPKEEIEISRTLVKQKIRGCGEYTYRRAGRGEYHVACWSSAGRPTYYLVFTVTGDVMGPYSK